MVAEPGIAIETELHHEAAQHAEEARIVVEAVLHQVVKAVGGVRRPVSMNLDDEHTLTRLEPRTIRRRRLLGKRCDPSAWPAVWPAASIVVATGTAVNSRARRFVSSTWAAIVAPRRGQIGDNSKRAGKGGHVSDDTKACPVCGEKIKAAAIKRRFCNTDLAARESAKEAEVERDLFVGHPAMIYSLTQWLIIVITIGIAAISIGRRAARSRTPRRRSASRSSAACCRRSSRASSCFESTTSTSIGRSGCASSATRCSTLRSSDPDLSTVIIHGIPTSRPSPISCVSARCASARDGRSRRS